MLATLGMSVLVGAKERRGWSLEKGLSGGSTEEFRRLVEPYLNSVEATGARSQLARRRTEASTQPLFAKP